MISKPKLQAEEFVALPFKGSLGRGVRVAVIDSGVNPAHPHISRVAGGVFVGGEPEADPPYLDVLGHGTAVCAAIQEKAAEAEIYAVKIFDTALRAKTRNLIEAIDWAIRNGMHLVNLSLGTTSLQRIEDFRSVVAKAAEQGVTLVAAREANGQDCLPGCLPGVIATGLDVRLNRNEYRAATNGVFFASGYPRPIPGMPPEHNLQGISFAVANMTGFAARACESLRLRSPQTIREALAGASVNTAAMP